MVNKTRIAALLLRPAGPHRIGMLALDLVEEHRRFLVAAAQ